MQWPKAFGVFGELWQCGWNYELAVVVTLFTITNCQCTNIKLLKSILDEHWLQQEIKYNWESEISGTGCRSYTYWC